MRLAQNAWNNVDTPAIQNRWQKANILPDNSDVDPAAHAETLVKTALDDLEAAGALQYFQLRDGCKEV